MDAPIATANPHRLTLADEAFAVFCEQGALALFFTSAMGFAGFAAVERPQRLHTGYQPAATRRAVAHGLYSMGIRKPRARATAADGARAEAVRWGIAR